MHDLKVCKKLHASVSTVCFHVYSPRRSLMFPFCFSCIHMSVLNAPLVLFQWGPSVQSCARSSIRSSISCLKHSRLSVRGSNCLFLFFKGQNGLLVCWLSYVLVDIDHFTVVFSVTWPLDGSETGGDLVLVQTSLLLFKLF